MVASPSNWSTVHWNTPKYTSIFRITCPAHKPFDPNNSSDKRSLTKWTFQNVYTKLAAIDPSFVWKVYPDPATPGFHPKQWRPITLDLPTGSLPDHPWSLGRFIHGGYLKYSGQPTEGLIYLRHNLSYHELIHQFNSPTNLWANQESLDHRALLSPWNIQDPHYDKCMWILGSTSQLNRAALGAALCQDPILQELGLVVEVTWAPIEASPDESCTLGHQRVHAAHICCEATRSQDCIEALFRIFEEDRPSEAYPLHTRFQCFINTGSYYLQPFGQQHYQCSELLRKVHQQQVSSLRRLIRPLSCLLAPSLGLFTLSNLQHHLHNHTAKDMTPLFLSILPSTTKGHLDLLYHRDHHSEVLQVLADLARHKMASSSSSFQPPSNTVMVPPGSPDIPSHMSLSPFLQSNLENLSQDAFLQGLIEAPNWS